MILAIILNRINEIPRCGENDWRFPKGIKGVKYKFDILLELFYSIISKIILFW